MKNQKSAIIVVIILSNCSKIKIITDLVPRLLFHSHFVLYRPIIPLIYNHLTKSLGLPRSNSVGGNNTNLPIHHNVPSSPPPPLPFPSPSFSSSPSPSPSPSSSSTTTATTALTKPLNKSSFSSHNSNDDHHHQHVVSILNPPSNSRWRDYSRSISPPPIGRRKGKGKGEGEAKKEGEVKSKGEGEEEGGEKEEEEEGFALESRVGGGVRSTSDGEFEAKLEIGKEKEKVDAEIHLKEETERELLSVDEEDEEEEGGEAVFHSASASDLNNSYIVPGPTFLDATVKKTWAYGYSREDGEDITIEEVLQRDDLRFAVMSSFQWNLEWLNSKINTDSTRLLLIVGAKEETLKRRWQYAESKMPHLSVCFAPMGSPVQIMHAKMMLLFHSTYLRIVVTTANMMPHDWGETGVMENTLFLIDLPRIPTGDTNPAEKLQRQTTSFEMNLVKFLNALGLYERLVQGLNNFDFSRTKDLAFVHSIGGAHVGLDEPWRQTGFCGLGLAIRELGLESGDGSPVSVDYVTSSLGATRPEFLQTLYMACQGDEGLTAYCWRNKITKSGEKLDRETEFEAERFGYDNIYANLRIYYPLRQTVENSRGGKGSGGTICFNGIFKSYPYRVKALMRDCQSRRSGLLMHNKLIFVRRLGHLSEPSPGWMYVGSANCSQMAWGAMTKDRQLGLPRLTCRNWECGVVIPMKKAVSVPRGMDGDIDHLSDMRGLSMSGGIIPVPMQILGMRYRGRNPWSQLRSAE